VLDSKLRIPLECELLATAEKVPVLIVTSRQTVQTKPQTAEAIKRKGAELLIFPDTQGQSNLYFLLDELSKRSIAQLLVEGGPTVISSFLKEQLADEICVYIAPEILGRQGAVDIAGPMKELTKAFDLHYVDIKNFGSDVRISGLSKKALDEIASLEG
jgi:diaminohydroxyphosphoribosylaminopyrimidine deaminase/5-amino-6-(5-phosphoribosylamino)uracil reductase